MFKATVLASSIALLTVSAFAADKRDASKPIIISQDQHTLQVNLKANATTGYSWYLRDYNKRYFTLQGYQYVAGNTSMPGAPGKAVFTFHVKPSFHNAPIATTISLTYMRPWDATTGVDKDLTVLSIPTEHHGSAAPKHKVMKLDTQAINTKVNQAQQMSSHQIDSQLQQMAPKPASTNSALSTAHKAAPKDDDNWLSVHK